MQRLFCYLAVMDRLVRPRWLSIRVKCCQLLWTFAVQLKSVGNEHMGLGDATSAIAAYTTALELGVKSLTHVLLSNRAAAYTVVGDLEKAMKDCSDCINCSPKDYING